MNFFFSKFTLFKEIWLFLKIRRKWWLLPVIIIFSVFAAAVVIGESSVIAPIISQYSSPVYS